MMSGRVAASSLYTFQLDAMMLLPPLTEHSRVMRASVSQTVSVWKGFSNGQHETLATFERMTDLILVLGILIGDVPCHDVH